MTPYLTGDLPGTGGAIKESPEDFHVTEIPLYTPCGDGEHVYVEFEKRGITTLEAIRRLAKAAGAAEKETGYAGLKDSRGVTRQTVSIPRIDPGALLAAEIPGLTILSAVRHRNKLRVGHLKGNRFRIVIRETAPDALERAAKVLEVLRLRGVPNYFGEQRYGAHGNSHIIGRHLLAGDPRGAVEALLGSGDNIRDERWREAVLAFRSGDLEESLRLMPGHCRTERDVLRRLVSRPDDFAGAMKTVHPRLKSLYLSACQSWLFDRVVAERIETIDRLLPGDVAWKHDNGACFSVTDPEAEQSRVTAHEISPTGPLFGPRMKEPEGEQREIEHRVLIDAGIEATLFAGTSNLEGARRPLRVLPTDLELSGDHGSLTISFTLPKGSYATTLLREIMKAESSSATLPGDC